MNSAQVSLLCCIDEMRETVLWGPIPRRLKLLYYLGFGLLMLFLKNPEIARVFLCFRQSGRAKR